MFVSLTIWLFGFLVVSAPVVEGGEGRAARSESTASPPRGDPSSSVHAELFFFSVALCKPFMESMPMFLRLRRATRQDERGYSGTARTSAGGKTFIFRDLVAR